MASGGLILMPSISNINNLGYSNYDNKAIRINPGLLNNKWAAQWISYPAASLLDYGVFLFRKELTLKKKPEQFIIHVSADNRYRLFVNGKEVCFGPARGDLLHWRFDTIDIADNLIEGNNVLAAVVWNFSGYAPLAQISLKTAFIMQGNNKQEEMVNTNESWKVFKNEAYKPLASVGTVVGPGTEIDGSQFPYGGDIPGFDDSSWRKPGSLGRGVPIGKFTAWDWMLVPRTIPSMEHTFQRITEVRRTENITVHKEFLKGKSPIYIPPHKNISILLDQTYETTAYPKLVVSGGKGSFVKIGYAEALVDDKGVKGNRDEIKGKHLESSFWDIFKPDGGEKREFSTLWFRTYRYMEIKIKTNEKALVIHDLYGYFTAYPFKENASFNSSDPVLKKIWDIGWRTARLCAGETYYDCPYYEQLQYTGDTRIGALISLYVSGDDRLMRNAINQFYHSLLPMGLTQSRYPCSQPQIIPPFSLFWICMIHDFWMHRDDLSYVKQFEHGIKSVFYWYKQQMDVNGMLGPMDWWNFVDWSFGPWNGEKPLGGVPPGGMTGSSSIITLLFALTLQKSADLFKAFGNSLQSQQYQSFSEDLVRNTYKHCWSRKRKLLADTPEKQSFSQHANIMAVLTGMFSNQQNKTIMAKILKDTGLIQTTFYFKFYLFRAMVKAGLADQYLQQLGPWKKMIDLGLTTFAETPEPTRSDCHQWSAHPTYDLLATVCGITPGSPGFKTVRISPHPGKLSFVKGKVPHPRGNVMVDLKKKGEKGIEGEITLPEGLSGEFIWQGEKILLKEGKQYVHVS